MTTLHATNPFNVEASLNSWLSVSLAAITKPSWLPSYMLVFNMPETGIATPSFSVTHLPVGTSDVYMGRVAELGVSAQPYAALMDVSAWVSRANVNWTAQLNTMKAMALQVANSTTGVRIQDYSAPATPTNTNFLARIGAADVRETAPDPNPDIRRVRILIRYTYTLRS